MTRSSSGKKKTGNPANPRIDEATRVRISRALDEFCQGDDAVYTFEANLSSADRAAVHTLCRRRGMKSKSSGRGLQRRVSVYKNTTKTQDVKQKKNVSSLAFSEETEKVLRDLFTRYPPGDEEQYEDIHHVGEVDKRRRHKDDAFQKPSMNKAEIAGMVEALASKMKNTPKLRQIVEQRSKLPIASFKDVITSTIETNQVVLISGETGCGKTTQVPQYLLDHMWGKGEVCKLVCTQPRRISAISVAERISHERGENVGDSVGFKIRLETKGGKQSSIMFCTNGILLRVLVGKRNSNSKTGSENETSREGLLEVTHIIVDEIHERDHYSDFILAILRDMLVSYPHLRLILMSATLDAERFSEYFGGCPIIRVPGFTYPVKRFYLEDILSILKSTESNHLDSASPDDTVPDSELKEDYTASLDEAINLAWSSDEFDPLLDLISSEGTPKIYNYQHSLTGATPMMVFAGRGRVSDVCMLLSLGADCSLCDKDGKTAMEWAQQENQEEIVELIKRHLGNGTPEPSEEQNLLEKYLASVNPELIDIILIERLIRKICTDSVEGAILIFLPGWDYINKTREKLLASPFFKDASKFLIMALHSMVPSAEQKKVFKRPPDGSRKIILSTNIAETAVTIDDVVYVIDSGRMKEKNYDPYNNVSTLHSSWISKASAKQREGRAGRCQPGICYHLYSKIRAASLPEFQVPEIKRMPIEELCLQVKLLDPNCRIVDFLNRTLDPPVSETVRNAIVVLHDIGALTADEGLTELGQKLGSLPVHPATSKMLFFGILMNCLDPALTLACASDYKDPFILPMAPTEKKKANSAREELASLYGGHSDQLIVIAAYECWRRAKERGQEAQFCSKYFVSSSTMHMLSSMRMQLQKELIRNGFMQDNVSECSLNAGDPGILHAVLVAGLYPMVGRLLPPQNSRQKCVVETASGAKVRLHLSSSNFKLSPDKSNSPPLLVYDEITRGDGGMHIRNCSVVGPYPLLIVATEIVVAPTEDYDDEGDEDCHASGSDEDGLEMPCEKRDERIMSKPDNFVNVVIDRWLTFQTTALDVAQIYCLRERLESAILFKVKYPKKALPPALEASMRAIACILSYDGLTGIAPYFKANASLTLLKNTAGTKLIKAKEVETSASDSSSTVFLRSLLNDDAPRNRHRHDKPWSKSSDKPRMRASDKPWLRSNDKPRPKSRSKDRKATVHPNVQQFAPVDSDVPHHPPDYFDMPEVHPDKPQHPPVYSDGLQHPPVYSDGPQLPPVYPDDPHHPPIYHDAPHHPPVYHDAPHHPPIYHDAPHHPAVYHDGPHHPPVYHNVPHHPPVYHDGRRQYMQMGGPPHPNSHFHSPMYPPPPMWMRHPYEPHPYELPQLQGPVYGGSGSGGHPRRNPSKRQRGTGPH